MSNPWSQSFDELRRPHLEEAKKKGDGNLANNYPPYDKVTRGDIIAGAKGEDQEGGKKKVKKEETELEEGKEELKQRNKNEMQRKAGNLGREVVSSNRGPKRTAAMNRMGKLVKVIARDDEDKRWKRMGEDPKHNANYKEEAELGGGVKKGGSYDKGYKAMQKEIEKLDKGEEPATAKRYKEMKKTKKESSDWKTELGIDDIIEAMVSTGEQDKKLDVKKGIKNKIVINPNLKLEEKGEDCECEPTEKEGKESGKGKHKEYKHPKGKEEKGEMSEASYIGEEESDRQNDKAREGGDLRSRSERPSPRRRRPSMADDPRYGSMSDSEWKKSSHNPSNKRATKEEVQYVDEVSPPGMEGTVKAMKKHKKEIDNPYALAWWMKGKGFKSHKKPSGAPKNEELDYWLDESQEARNNPEKYEAGEKKKYTPVRGEKTPMPPRGNKKREDFEKWYAANVK